MTRNDFSRTADIPAPLPLVWSVLAGGERWPTRYAGKGEPGGLRR